MFFFASAFFLALQAIVCYTKVRGEFPGRHDHSTKSPNQEIWKYDSNILKLPLSRLVIHFCPDRARESKSSFQIIHNDLEVFWQYFQIYFLSSFLFRQVFLIIHSTLMVYVVKKCYILQIVSFVYILRISLDHKVS